MRFYFDLLLFLLGLFSALSCYFAFVLYHSYGGSRILGSRISLVLLNSQKFSSGRGVCARGLEQYVRRKIGQQFLLVPYEHVSLTNLKCKVGKMATSIVFGAIGSKSKTI